MPDRKNPDFEKLLTPGEIRDRRREEIARNNARKRRAEYAAQMIVLIPLVLLIASALIWLTAQIWVHMPW